MRASSFVQSWNTKETRRKADKIAWNVFENNLFLFLYFRSIRFHLKVTNQASKQAEKSIDLFSCWSIHLPNARWLKCSWKRSMVRGKIWMYAKCRFKISITLAMNRELGSDSLPLADLTHLAITDSWTLTRTRQSHELFYRISDSYCRTMEERL